MGYIQGAMEEEAMPWKESSPVDNRMRLIARHLEGERMTDLCKEFGISRKTGYKFLERFEQHGLEGLENRSRRHASTPLMSDPNVEKLIVHLREARPTWGPKKIKAYLENKHSGLKFPASSTIGDILERKGLVTPRKRRRIEDRNSELSHVESHAPNEIWCADFKGQFRLGDKTYCYPLTISDHYTRYLLMCDALSNTRVGPALSSFEALFAEFGVPDVIRSDNGVPFSARGYGGISELSAWWMSLGILPDRITPGHPEQNGRHERMHRVLKAETTRPVAKNQLSQQERFDRFRGDFNDVRPHEALQMKKPAEIYVRSKRSLQEAQRPFDYSLFDTTRKIDCSGNIKLYRQKSFFIGRAFRGRTIGIRALEEDIYITHLNRFELGFLNGKTGKFTQTHPHLDPEE